MAAAVSDNISLPMLVLSGPNENREVLEEYLSGLHGETYSETFEKMCHGWMGGRNPLRAQSDVDEYQRGYEILLEWFGKTVKNDQETSNGKRKR